MSQATIIAMPFAEQECLLKELRAGRYGRLLALHILLLSAAGRTPTDIATWLFCSRSSVYRTVKAYQAGVFREPPGKRSGRLSPSLRRSLLAILRTVPRRCGWWRTRWSCATIALELRARRGIRVSAETIRRWVHEVGWVWKRTKLTAPDKDPHRVTKLARIRAVFEQLTARQAFFFADELDIQLLPKLGAQWMPKGEQVQLPTPGTNQKQYLAGALDMRTGQITHCVWARKTTGLFLELLEALDTLYPPRQFTRLYVVVDNAKVHHARAVTAWLAAHPRIELLFLPTYCPQANPIERAFGDVHDKCTRNHTRKRLCDLVTDVQVHFLLNAPWRYHLAALYYAPEVTTAMQALTEDHTHPRAA